MQNPLFLVIEASGDSRPWFPCELSWADPEHREQTLVIDVRGYEPWAYPNTTYYERHSVTPDALDAFATIPAAAGRIASSALDGREIYSLRPELDAELLGILFAETLGRHGAPTILSVDDLFVRTLRTKGYRTDECYDILKRLSAETGHFTWQTQDVHELHTLVGLWGKVVTVTRAPN